MKNIIMMTAVLGMVTVGHAGIAGFNEIEFWVGSGANEAALILDFQDGETKQSFAWGYRWDGVASGADMIIDIAAADANLTLTHGGNGASGYFTSSIEYFDGVDNHFAAGGSFATFPDDYLSWGYYLSGGTAGDDLPGPGGTPVAIAGGGPVLPASWTLSPVGASQESFGESGRLLQDGAWDALSFGQVDAGFTHTVAPSSEVFAAAIPEPNTVLLMAGGFGGLMWFRRRKKYYVRG